MNSSSTLEKTESGESCQGAYLGLGNAIAILEMIDLQGVGGPEAPDAFFGVKANEAMCFDVTTEIHVEVFKGSCIRSDRDPRVALRPLKIKNSVVTINI